MAWLVLTIGFVWLVDPYGVSPLKVDLAGINSIKHRRIDIDRQIKVLEVLQKQPRTIFMGTSRIHQSIDPAVLAGTAYAPAYNAAIPGSSISENAAHLEQYFAVSGSIRNVFVEGFFYDFTRAQSVPPPGGFEQLALNAAGLLLSTGSVVDSFATVLANRRRHPHRGIISPGGHWLPPAALDTEQTFQASIYANSVLAAHRFQPDLSPTESAFVALARIAELCRRHGAKLHILITPNYPWDDYRLQALGHWPNVEKWLSQLAGYGTVYSLSQYNRMLEEPAGHRMIYWYDPVHFSAAYGRQISLAIAGVIDPARPENLLRIVTAETVGAVLKERRDGLADWVRRNPGFVSQFDAALKGLDDTDAYHLSGTLSGSLLTMNGQDYEVVPRIGGSIEGLSEFGDSRVVELHGWVADHRANKAAKEIIVTLDGKPYFRSRPTSPRKDIEAGVGKGITPAGFRFSFKAPGGPSGGVREIRVFAISEDGKAVPVAAGATQGQTVRLAPVEFPKG